ncbi:hypothetical protein ACFVGV_17720 [Pseudarthrobacter scleromae]|uniref:hypothetical protein n=1 Tax=Pseudarthrobacter scleromae TaxID=158897 RepID=UPI0036394149
MPKQTTLTAESRQDDRGVWRIGESDIEDYIEEAYRRTAERIAAGELVDEGDAE